MNLVHFSLKIWHLVATIFPGLSRTKLIFQDFPGPWILKKKITDFPGGVGILIIINFNHRIGYPAAPAPAVAAATAPGRSMSHMPPQPADVTRCGLPRTQAGNQKWITAVRGSRQLRVVVLVTVTWPGSARTTCHVKGNSFIIIIIIINGVASCWRIKMKRTCDCTSRLSST